MEKAEVLSKYIKLNNSFKKKLVFRLGVEAGFFSEYNNMLLAMVYCLKHRIRFEYYADYTKYAFNNAWTDFFRPFSVENHHYINRHYNTRPDVLRDSREPALKKRIKYEWLVAAYKTLSGVTYFTQDVWKFHRDRAFAETILELPELGLPRASVLEVTKLLIAATWRYNEQSAALVNELVVKANLPAEYLSIHVRAGDKFMETGMFDFSEYMRPAEELSGIRHAFILTDDYTVVEHLQAQYPDWHFYTLCQPDERGYFHYEFLKQSPEYKYRQHLKLFASMDICAASTKFIGTYSSNPGMFMGMRIGEERCHCLDFSRWLIW